MSPLISPPLVELGKDDQGNDANTDPAPEEVRYWKAKKEDIGWFQRVVDIFWDFWVWFVKPVCLLVEVFFNWLGLPEEGGTIDFTLGAVGYFAGIVDSWIPLHETINHVFRILTVVAVWLPFKLIIKYFFPGLGG